MYVGSSSSSSTDPEILLFSCTARRYYRMGSAGTVPSWRDCKWNKYNRRINTTLQSSPPHPRFYYFVCFFFVCFVFSTNKNPKSDISYYVIRQRFNAHYTLYRLNVWRVFTVYFGNPLKGLSACI
jgi:hypothetical protein